MDEDDRLFELLEGYLCALQAGNVAECARLRSLEPGIAKFAKSFEALDSFLPAAPVTLSTPAPQTDGGTPASTLPLATPAAQFGRNPSPVPQTLGEYQLLEDVLRSAWSTTWRARIVASGRSVAITFLSPRRRLAEGVIERLRNVAAFRPRGVDGGLIAVIGSGMANGLQFLVLDNVAGTPLSERITTVGSDPVQVARIVASLARDVEAIQSAKLTVDRVDAEQILIDNGGRVFLTDYWCNLSESSALPGNASATRSAEPAIRAMGDLLAGLLRLPAQYRSTSAATVIDDESRDDVPPDSSCQPLATICRQCVRPAAGRAYHTVSEVAADLERYLRGEPILAAPPTWRERCGWWLVEEPTLGPRVVTVFLAITIVQSRHLLAHQPWSHHAEIKLILLLWGILSFGFRWLAVRRATRALGRIVWALTDVVFVSTCLALTEPEMGSLLIVYPLLQALTSLWRCGPLMTLTTFASLAGYATVLWFRKEPQPQPHYHVLAMAAIALTGLFLKPQRSRHEMFVPGERSKRDSDLRQTG